VSQGAPLTAEDLADDLAGDFSGDPNATVLILPAAEGFARFEWRNYCGSHDVRVTLEVELPDGGNLMVVPENSRGIRLSGAPSCFDKSLPSTISSGSFVDPKIAGNR
jgi:hypothetical protein